MSTQALNSSPSVATIPEIADLEIVAPRKNSPANGDLVVKHKDKLKGVLSCYDRIVLTGNLYPLCFPQGATNFLYRRHVRIFDYVKFAEPLRDEIVTAIETLAKDNGLAIEWVTPETGRKEARIQAILQTRGQAPGIVHIFAAMERCRIYKPWHDKASHKTYLKTAKSQCKHYYIYFIDPDLGLCYLRIPTYCPFRLQFYFNGHSWLAQQLTAKGVAFQMRDNAFVDIADFEQANALAAQLDVKALQTKLDEYACRYCPPVKSLNLTCKWGILQTEYATDLVFKDPAALQAFYPHLLELLILAVKPADIATFLGRKLHGNFQGEMESRLSQVRHFGTRIKHSMGRVSLKLYDKFGVILRIETTVNDVSFFRQYRQVHHRTGQPSKEWAPLLKSVYSLGPLRELLLAANQRYLKFISALDTPEVGVHLLNHVAETVTAQAHRYKGFNLLAQADAELLRVLARGEFAIGGFTHKDLRALLADKTAGQVSRLLKRLRVHGLIKKVGKRYKYYLTELGRQITTMALKLRETFVIPILAQTAKTTA
jgi:hypothetical protein